MLKNKIFSIALLIAIVATLGGCTSSAASKPVQPRPTATTIPAGTTLYRADWSHDFARWNPPAGWKLVNGQPQSDLSDAISLTVPYRPAVPNYAVEFRLQVVSVPQDGGYFMLWADKTPTQTGYHADVLNLLTPGHHAFAIHPLSEVLLDPEDAAGSAEAQVFDYEPGSQWRTYRVEVQGPQVAFFVDGTRVSRARSLKTPTLSNGPIRLEAGKAVLRVDTFTITAL